MKASILRVISLFPILAAMTACGGGGSSGGFSPPPPPPPPSGWQPGVFQDYISFYARCENPRSGIDPATNQPYPDVPGSTLDENNFLRSYSNDTYLWYDEIVDRDPGLYNDPLDYFSLLRTTAITPSGAPKDKFHFTYDTQEWYDLYTAGVTYGYGAQFVLLSAVPPREVVVAYTEPNTPATNLNPPLERGARILSIDGYDIDVNTAAGVDALNEGLFPSDTTTSHTFEVLDPGAANTRTVTMTAATIDVDPVQGEQIIDTAMGKVGYMSFHDHIAVAEQEMIDAVNYFNTNGPIDELVLDIRYNGGGYLALASELAYMIAGPGPTAGMTFELQQFNDKYPDTNPLFGNTILPMPFYTRTLGDPVFDNGVAPDQPLPTLNLGRVYVLTGSGTCSASEAIMNSLRGVDVEVIQIGSTTCGKPYGFYDTDNCGTTYFTIQFRGVNAKNFGDYTDGFSPVDIPSNMAELPGCIVSDDYDHLLGDPAEARLSAALDYVNGNGCPAPAGLAPGDVLGKPGAPTVPADGILPKSPWHTNRIYVP